MKKEMIEKIGQSIRALSKEELLNLIERSKADPHAIMLRKSGFFKARSSVFVKTAYRRHSSYESTLLFNSRKSTRPANVIVTNAKGQTVHRTTIILADGCCDQCLAA